ncbi:MAG: hypothetical protein HZT40_17635 [Candidatus Thiothrix singaporensis]|uniref:Uncharacterized protein n=1 Tax=Candidatus Thiothrix singaporensis TaxID=2799669 RepID=A0A7L6AVM2_9GAMM|nr:MAG: hypothetical protein HZT40_17635 [Candidatus Thiothrix singaporensis]
MGTVVVLELVRAQLALSGLMLALGLLAQGCWHRWGWFRRWRSRCLPRRRRCG